MILDIGFLDDATRPTVPRLEGVTPAQRAAGEHLRDVHDHIRGELQTVKVLIQRASTGLVSKADIAAEADKLAAMGLSATLADARFAKPLDEDLIRRLAREHEVVVTVEEGAQGGFGAFVLHFLAREGALDRGLKIRTLTLPDLFQDQDKPEAMYAQAGLDAEGIMAGALAALGVGNASAAGRRA